MADPGERGAEQRAKEAVGVYFIGDLTMEEALEKLCQAALDAVPPAVLAGISMTVDARSGTYVFTHPDLVDIDRRQYDTGDGPCLDAFRTGEPVMIPSTRDHSPYPQFCAVAEQHGMLSVLSMPMIAGEHVVGTMNLYAAAEGAFGTETVATARGFATQVAYLLLNHQAYWDARSLSENLMEAMASRAQIEQAKGIIMAFTGCSPEEAFDLLREQSQHENVKLRDVAREVVERTQQR